MAILQDSQKRFRAFAIAFIGLLAIGAIVSLSLMANYTLERRIDGKNAVDEFLRGNLVAFAPPLPACLVILGPVLLSFRRDWLGTIESA
jgi:hypothetical protein